MYTSFESASIKAEKIRSETKKSSIGFCFDRIDVPQPKRT